MRDPRVLPGNPGEGKNKNVGAAAQKKEVHQSEGVGTAFWGATAPIFLLLLRPRRFVRCSRLIIV